MGERGEATGRPQEGDPVSLTWSVLLGDALERLRGLPDAFADCCATSPPYWALRDYGVDGQIGLEQTPDEYVNHLVTVFCEVRRVLRPDGTLWLNLGDSYAGGGCGSRDPERWPKQARNDHMPKHVKKLCGTSVEPRARNLGMARPKPSLAKMRALGAGLKEKDLIGIPWAVAFALRADGWYLRSDIIWAKPNPMPESVADRPTKSHEHLFLLSASERYFYDADAIREPLAPSTRTSYGTKRRSKGNDPLGRVKSDSFAKTMPHRKPRLNEDGSIAGANKRDVWTVATRPYPEAHFATYPPELVEPCVLAGSRRGGLVIDPFCGSGTTGQVALANGRSFIGIELNPQYLEMARRRLRDTAPLFAKEAA